MGSRYHPNHPRGRVWRRSAGAAPFASGPDLVPPEAPSDAGPRDPRTLETTDTLRPGEPGTKRLAAEFGDRLVCVRYRRDPVNRKRYKTVELIVAEADWEPPPGPEDLVQVRVAFAEEELRQQVKQAGGRWRPDSKTWELPLRAVEELGLRDRVVADVRTSGNQARR